MDPDPAVRGRPRGQAMTAAQQRKIQRGTHLAAALAMVAYVYGPSTGHLHDAMRFVVLPVLAVTGIAMWQAARIRRLRRATTRTRTLEVTAAASRPAGHGKG